MSPQHHDVLHATALSIHDNGVLLIGASGAGKSDLALRCLALPNSPLLDAPFQLVSDDQSVVSLKNSVLTVSAPDSLAGLIEARGLGLLHATATEAALHTVLDLDTDETERLPPLRRTELLEHSVPLLHNSASGGFAAALMQYLRAGRRHV